MDDIIADIIKKLMDLTKSLMDYLFVKQETFLLFPSHNHTSLFQKCYIVLYTLLYYENKQ